uniref:Large T antigen n=1 Tax=Trichodysplasia spinulosa-associated polyomavirus TaxID=862909 RepID=A0A068EVP3_9POLY|nr:large T antigen [Trichodysplasia spinulosa-associated polyomavirus]AOA60182.1 large T antigen [Trichodysplasia spinulosa-associated polyomavirus]AOA60187.1 LTAg [Trichodysplasia spinulosa-associated polyomavirus]AOA60192.1 LTAg [Trichodysplasia spinulosa-associated polyomavirus]AOA60197.1 LTAg [Trichodysplasia spinulosa-associated polyomavirus]
MDKFLSREESLELMDLLQIPRHCYGNFALMKINHKKMSLKYHPDKGGDPEKMSRLNQLWQKLQEGIYNARQEFPTSFSSQHDVPTQDGRDIPPYGHPSWASWWESFNQEWDNLFDTMQDPDLFCHESTIPSDESRSPSPTPGPSTQFSEENPRRRRAPPPEDSPGCTQSSFSATPPKPKKSKYDSVPNDFPDMLRPFLSNAVYSNKTLSSFLIYTTNEKAEYLYKKLDKFNPEFKSRHSFQEGSMVFLMTPGKHRVSAIKNLCVTHCTVSFLLCKAVIKQVECYRCMCSEPFKLLEESKPGIFEYEFNEENGKPVVNWNLLTDFAVTNRLDDPLLIMAHYLDFAEEPSTCSKCTKKALKAHYNYHSLHHKNAKLFKECKTQKTACQQAADVVMAKQRLKLIESTRKELLEERFKLMFEKLTDEFGQIKILQYMAGVAWYSCLFENIDEVVTKILKLIVENVPKKRNCLFRGPINSGKTTFAAALMNFLGGKTLNVNCPADKLPFELGCAIDQFVVIFEDVKGQIALNKKLQPGQGVANLDNLRDHLDGSVKVNLERKHVNKRSQIFPPCLVTMNEYLLPETIFTRFAYVLNFTPKHNLRSCLQVSDYLLTERILQDGVTIALLLVWYCPITMFSESIKEDVKYWKDILCKYMGHTNFATLLLNVEEGKDPLDSVVIEVEDEEEEEFSETNDSGFQTQ